MNTIPTVTSITDADLAPWVLQHERRRIAITLHLAPHSKGRHRDFLNKRTGRRGRVADPKTKSWEHQAGMLAKVAMQQIGYRRITGACSIFALAHFVPAKSWPPWKRQAALDGLLGHTGVPDGDNLLKAICDAMNGILFVDDKLLIDKQIRKTYSRTARVELVVCELRLAPATCSTALEFKEFL